MSDAATRPPSNSPQNRWVIPVGAVLVHVCIGSVYAWSTFNRPIQALFPDSPWWFSPPYTTFTTALALLGLSAAFGGPWVERRGPRVAATAAALFFGTGLLLGGLGLMLRQNVLVFLGMGVGMVLAMPESKNISFWFSVIGLTVMAMISTYWIEKPIARRLRRRLAPQLPAAQGATTT